MNLAMILETMNYVVFLQKSINKFNRYELTWYSDIESLQILYTHKNQINFKKPLMKT